MDAQTEEKISSLREELYKELRKTRLDERAHVSTSYIEIRKIFFAQVRAEESVEACSRAHKEIYRLLGEYSQRIDEASAAEGEKIMQEFTDDINRVTRSAGLGEILKRVEYEF